MVPKLLKASVSIINLAIFILLVLIINYALWSFFGNQYVNAPPVGGDYYNALTYLLFVKDHSPNLTQGWFSFWNEGNPLIGGYPFFVFYILKPLMSKLDPIILLNYFSFYSLVLFFASSLLLFWQVSKNWIFAAGATILLISTRASYNQLTTGGYIISASIQWYLPLTLFFLYRFRQTKRIVYLTIASILCGLSFIHQAPSAFLMVFTPSLLTLLAILTFGNFKKNRILRLFLFLLLNLGIGSLGLYSVILQNFLGSGTDNCISPQCWGDYPQHLTTWLHAGPPLLALFLLVTAIVTKFFHKKTRLFLLLPSIIPLIFFIIYALAAHFKLINGLTNVMFPTRLFWAFNLYLLLLASSAFYVSTKLFRHFSYIVASIVSLTILAIAIQKPVNIHKDFTATLPQNLSAYVIPRFQEKPISLAMPDWVIKSDPNYRLDISNSHINQWYYLLTKTPSTRGYSNHPLGSHKDWQFFLENSTRNVDPTLNSQLTKNRALFLIDAFGIGIYETSSAKYPDLITNDPKIISTGPKLNEHFWFEISRDFTTPIVSATNVQPVLFVGSNNAYNSFIRAIAIVNMNSRILIPVKGYKNVNDLSKEELETFKTIVLYGFADSLSDLSKLSEFVKNGGKVFIETGSLNKPYEKLPEFFPISKIAGQNARGHGDDFKAQSTEITKNIKLENFSPLLYKNTSWKISTSKAADLRSWAKPSLTLNDEIILAEGQIGKGHVIWSGLNLPFHIVENNNLDEAALLQNILTELLDENLKKPISSVIRNKPEKIQISGDFNGIYFKENYNPGWQANLDGHNLKIYQAGLDFMYVAIPKNELKPDLKINLSFEGNYVEKAVVLVTIVSLLTSLIYLLIPNIVNKFILSFLKFIRKKSASIIGVIMKDEE